MKNILMIGTGGTIASEMTPSGLTPELNSTQLLSFVPRIGEMCHVDCVQLYSLDSTNIRPAHWLGVARAVRENYDRYDGFVISHGTDTMAYTAAALSYLIQGSPKPIVLTGAQKPIWFDGTDSKRNLTDAFLYACRGCGGVQIVFNGKVILAAYDAGDETAVQVVNTYVHYLCVGVTSIINIFQPEVLCLGGGISRRSDVLVEPIRAFNAAHGYGRSCPKQPRIMSAELFGDAGIIGAALLGKGK